MISYRLSEIAKAIGGRIQGQSDPLIHYVFIDSRSPINSVNALFIALKGERHDGHLYIEDLYRQGVSNFLVSEIPSVLERLEGASFIVANNTLHALQALAAFHRQKFDIPVIGITGSNGKTVVKEWLFHLIDAEKNITRSPKSYNSQVGVPLSVLLLESHTTMGIFEAGISRPGEMEKIAEIIRPSIGILTNLGEAHQENFSSYQAKLDEKLKLFRDTDYLIYCSDNEIIRNIIELRFNNTHARLINWSREGRADLTIQEIIKSDSQTSISGEYRGKSGSIIIPFIDDASIENAIHCWLLLLSQGLASESVLMRFLSLPVVAMRLELKKGVNSCTLINDSYNSDFVSLMVAIDFLMQQNQNPKKTLILSDILQSGKKENELYAEVARMLDRKGINRLIGIGPSLISHSAHFSVRSEFYRNTDEFLKTLSGLSFNNEAILLKGARNYEFERISDALELKTHATRLEINLNALVHNLNHFRSLLRPETKIMIMVKALSYGSGTFEIANLLQFHKVDYLAVAYADEAVELRKGGIRLPIMVMNPEPRSFESIIDFRLEPEIYSQSLLKKFINFLKTRGIRYYPVHIKLDTGMHRLGMNEADLPALVDSLIHSEDLIVHSLFSHLAASEDAKQDDFTRMQIRRFGKMSDPLLQSLPYPVLRHILNSAGIERFPEAQFDMVRLGIGLHGISTQIRSKLRNVGTLKSVISQIRKVSKGDTIGYGRSGLARKDIIIAVVPIGYADGLNRRLGNGAAGFLVNGKLAQTVGNICMDMSMIDVTDIDANEGDEVIIFGEQLPVTILASKLNTIPYEILTSISTRINRVYFQE